MSFQDKNLLVVAPHYMTFVKNQVDALQRYFEKVTVIALTPFVPKFLSKFSFMNPRWKRDASVYDYKYDNVEVYFAKHFTLPFEHFRKKRGDVAFKAVNKIIQKEKIEFDLIHAHFTWPSGYVGAKLKKEYDKSLVITGHGYDVYGLPFKNAGWNKKIRGVLNTADHIITPSKCNYNKLMQLDIPAEKVFVISNGYDPNLFNPITIAKARENLNLPKDKKIILSIGNLESVKGHKYLIEAMKIVTEREKNILCLIIGSGSRKNNLKNLIGRLDLGDYIQLLGGKSHNKIPIWMNTCDVFVLPSLSEGNPTVMFEALGCGKPFVGTNVGGIPEIIINTKYGILVEPKDVDGLAKAILRALEVEWDMNYILNYAKQFTWNKIAEKTLMVYQTLSKKT